MAEYSWGNSAECKENTQTETLEERDRIKWLEMVQKWDCDVLPVMNAWHRVGGCLRSQGLCRKEASLVS